MPVRKQKNIVKINKDKCKGCQLCLFFCPVKIIDISEDLNKRGVKYAKIKSSAKCKACGFCYLVCPDWCIKIETD